MGQVSTIGLDIAKRVFQAHGADSAGNEVFRKKLARGKVLEFLASQPSCVVALEACGGAHHWGREIAKLGHRVKLIAPKYVKPFVKRQKNDAADAEAICEAAQRPTMRFVAVKSAEGTGGASGISHARPAGASADPDNQCVAGPLDGIWFGRRSRGRPCGGADRVHQRSQMANSLPRSALNPVRD